MEAEAARQAGFAPAVPVAASAIPAGNATPTPVAQSSGTWKSAIPAMEMPIINIEDDNTPSPPPFFAPEVTSTGTISTAKTTPEKVISDDEEEVDEEWMESMMKDFGAYDGPETTAPAPDMDNQDRMDIEGWEALLKFNRTHDWDGNYIGDEASSAPAVPKSDDDGKSTQPIQEPALPSPLAIAQALGLREDE